MMGKEKERRPQYEFQGLSADVSLKRFWSRNDRFADLFNTCLYDGKEVLKPETLRDMDTDVSVSMVSKELQKELKRTRDVVKMAEDGRCYRILGIENQQAIHYAMPLRCMVYDALIYLHQVEERTKENRRQKRYDNVEEFLSGWKKEDRLIPCYTIVIYWGERPWDGPKKLSDMVAFDTEGQKNQFHDYQMKLICVNEETDHSFRNEDVGKLFQTVQGLYAAGGRRLPEVLQDVNVEVAYTAAAVTRTTKQYGRLIDEAIRTGKESVDMCEAVERVLREEREEGRKEGREEGRKYSLCSLVRKGIITAAQAAEELGVSVEEVNEKVAVFIGDGT